MRLSSKTAFVTGGGAGIGKAIATRLAEEGAAVAVFDIDGGSAEGVAAEITARGRQALAIPGNVADPADVHKAIHQTEHVLGGLDVLVNNAGVRHIASIGEETLESWNHTLSVDLTGAFLCLQEAVPAFRRSGGGKVINVGSISGMSGFVRRVAYCAAKAGLHGLTRQAAAELAAINVQVNAVAPGYIETGLATYDPEIVSAMLKTSPTKRRGSAEEVAALVAFLASSESDLITGTVIPVDGGVTSSVLIDGPPWRVEFGPDSPPAQAPAQ